MLKVMYAFIAIALLAALAGLFFTNKTMAPAEQVEVTKEKVAVMCTADAMQCPDGSFVGRTGEKCEFVCSVGATSTDSTIRVDNPAQFALVSSPLSVTGSAMGAWFFEGMFPIELQDASGNIIIQSGATAVGEWMKDDFVPFVADLNFSLSSSTLAGKTGKLVLRKDNPSGMPENDGSIEVPIRFVQ